MQLLILVAPHLKTPGARERLVRSLKCALIRVDAAIALILADTNGISIQLNGPPVEIRSVAEWRLTL